MKKKKIVALLAAIAAVLGFGFASGTAMAADDYGAVGTISGTTVSFDFTGFTPGETVTITYDDTYVESVTVTPVAMKSVPATAGPTGGVHVTYTLKPGTPAGTTISATAVGETSKLQLSTSVVVPATGEGTPSGNQDQVAQTGAAIMPYVVAAVLLIAAGIAVFAARKSSARR